MNNKGFTVVELIASFALTMIICLFLFEVLIDTKDVYSETAIKTEIQEYLGIVSKNIRRTLKANPNKDQIDIKSNYIKVGGQKFNTPKNVKIGKAKDSSGTVINQVQDYCNMRGDCYIKITLVLTHPNLSKDYEYNTVFYYQIT